ncbi:MAG: RluA family pseudouridine synthase [Ruminococcaceae bacterium]|nr:RluA family pseudouridine synthase [Oscillospiraceae bacterium]
MMYDDRLVYIVNDNDNGRTLQKVLQGSLDISSAFIRDLKRCNGMFINGEKGRTVDIVKTGDTVTVMLNVTDQEPTAYPENIPLDILYEDNAIIAVHKPQNMPVHPTCLHQYGTLSNAMAFYMIKNDYHGRIHIVSRLDRDTSGIVLFARNGFVQEQLKKQGFRGEFIKTYYGLCAPSPNENSGFINLPIKRKEGSIMERTIADDGIEALTEYHVVERFHDKALVKFHLHTGRTHQIRVHTSHSGFPLIGDELYGGSMALPELDLQGQALWAGKMEFIHPVTKKPISIVDRTPAWWPDESLEP